MEPCLCRRKLLRAIVRDCSDERMQCVHVRGGRTVKRICKKRTFKTLRIDVLAMSGLREQQCRYRDAELHRPVL